LMGRCTFSITICAQANNVGGVIGKITGRRVKSRGSKFSSESTSRNNFRALKQPRISAPKGQRREELSQRVRGAVRAGRGMAAASQSSIKAKKRARKELRWQISQRPPRLRGKMRSVVFPALPPPRRKKTQQPATLGAGSGGLLRLGSRARRPT
jgi:hypothetical protein